MLISAHFHTLKYLNKLFSNSLKGVNSCNFIAIDSIKIELTNISLPKTYRNRCRKAHQPTDVNCYRYIYQLVEAQIAK